MYFIKVPQLKWTHQLFSLSKSITAYYLFTACSRGKLSLTKNDNNTWTWQVELYPKFGPKESVGIRNTRRTGCAHSLYRAAQLGLQHLLSHRKTRVSVLLEILVKNQVMYELSKIGM